MLEIDICMIQPVNVCLNLISDVQIPLSYSFDESRD